MMCADEMCNGRRRAEPKDVLVKRHQQFQRRMARHYLNQSTAAAETGEEKETTRAALGKLSRAQASGATSSRVAAPPANVNNSSSTRGSMQAQSTALPQSQSRVSTGQAGPANAIGFEIFSDSRPSGGAGKALLCVHVQLCVVIRHTISILLPLTVLT